MDGESSYENGRMPFKRDPTRGYWASSSDFIFTCVGNAFKMDTFLILPSLMMYQMGFLFIIPYFFTLFVFVVPIINIQSFLGQFSSSGMISVFRIAPLFKGLGYASVAINITTLCYYSALAAIPLVFFFHSFRPTLPWSCGGIESWSGPEVANFISICNYNASEHVNLTYLYLPSSLFFESHLMSMDIYKYEATKFSFSWSLLGGAFAVWIVATCVVRQSTETIGKIIRYAVLTVVAIQIVCLIRFMFLPGALVGFKTFFTPRFDLIEWIFGSPSYAISSFGPGWGIILSMASYNKFKTNISRFSWIICVGQFVIMMLFGLTVLLVEFHLKEISSDKYFLIWGSQWDTYLRIASVIAHMEFPNLWSLIFFAMLIIASFVLIIVQLFSVLTAIFDEFERLQGKRQETILVVIGAISICSVYFCSNHGFFLIFVLTKDIALTQTLMNILLLVLVLWIYGRERLQRDIGFMTGQIFPTWRYNVWQILSTTSLLIVLLVTIEIMIELHYFNNHIWTIDVAVLTLPWFIIPGYAVFMLFQTTGIFFARFRRCVRPTDWYPSDLEDRRKYEELMGDMEMTQPLNEIQTE